jgi:hypothetical protein
MPMLLHIFNCVVVALISTANVIAQFSINDVVAHLSNEVVFAQFSTAMLLRIFQ